MSRSIRLSLFLLGLALLAAAPAVNAVDLLKRGNQAYRNKNYDRALSLYEQSAPRSKDPGLIAFNKAAALFRLGRFREAALHYNRCLEDARGQRRQEALLYLGISLLRDSQGEKIASLEKAIEVLRTCRNEYPSVNKASRNLEVARLLLAKARKIRKKEDKDNQNQKTGNTPDKGNSKTGKDNKNPNTAANSDQKPNTNADQKIPEDAQERKSQKATPGAGNLETLPDEGELIPLDREDTLKMLQKATQRISQERRAFRQSGNEAAPHIKDW